MGEWKKKTVSSKKIKMEAKKKIILAIILFIYFSGLVNNSYTKDFNSSILNSANSFLENCPNI